MPLLSTIAAGSVAGWTPHGGAPITGAEFTIWAGGNSNGSSGRVRTLTGQTLAPASHTVTIGGASTESSLYLGSSPLAIADPYAASNVVNATYSPSSGGGYSYGTAGFFNAGDNYNGYYRYGYSQVNGGSPGAGGNGGNYSGGPYENATSGDAGPGFSSGTSFGLAGFPVSVSHGGNGDISGYPVYVENYYWWDFYEVYGFYGQPAPITGGNSGSGQQAFPSVAAGSGGMTLRYPSSQAPLSSTSGNVTYLNSGGYHNYYWKSTGGFTR